MPAPLAQPQTAGFWPSWQPWRTVISGDGWKLNLSPVDQCELYDLNDDPALVDRMMKEAVDLVEVVLSEVAAASRATGRPLPRMTMIAIDMGE